MGLIRGEAAGDLCTLTATGATGGTRRTLTGGTLALLGVLLGTAGADLALLAGYHDDLAALGRVPAGHLLVIVVGLPVTAAAVGWLLAGREPSTLAASHWNDEPAVGQPPVPRAAWLDGSACDA